MCKISAKSKTSARDGSSPPPVNYLTIGGVTYSLGDLRKADFSAIENPKASVISLAETLTAILDVLRGHSEG